MHHHDDDYSVADLRCTLAEAWRVVATRRWHFIIPFCVVATAALIGSLWVPRTYTAGTVIQREHDPILANMMGRSWTEPYGEIRKRIKADITAMPFILDVLAALDLPEQVRGQDPARVEPARRQMAEKVIEGLTIKTIESSRSRDVVSIELALKDEAHLADILSRIRDDYVAAAKKCTVEILRDVQRFFQSESKRCRTSLTALQKRIGEMESRYPGINPKFPDPLAAELATLLTERNALESTIETLDRRREQLVRAMESPTQAHAKTTNGAEVADGESDASSNASEGVERIVTREVPADMEPNPQALAISEEIDRLTREIALNKSVRLMTDEHPTNIRLRRTIELRADELKALPALVVKGTAARQAGPSERDLAQAQLAETEGKLSVATGRLKRINDQAMKIQHGQRLASDHRDAYLTLVHQADRAREELDGWQANLGPLTRVLTLEDSNRGVHFQTIQETLPAAKPLSPDARVVLLVCLGIGGAVGFVCLLLAELLDRSFQTVRQLGQSIGVPLIECIDEIMTPERRRRRRVNQFLVMPAVTGMLILAVITAGTLAYVSIAFPRRFERMRETPAAAYRIAWDASADME